MVIAGAGKTSTIIQSSKASYSVTGYLFSFLPDATTAQNDYKFGLSGLHLKAIGSYPPYALLNLSNATPDDSLHNVLIHDNNFTQLASGSSRMAIQLQLGIFGVTYNNTITEGTHAWRFLGSLSGFTDMETGAGEQWEPGSANAMYFEDNTLLFTDVADGTPVVSGGAGNRHVTRYNDFLLNLTNAISPLFDIHANQANNAGAGIGAEIYGNYVSGGRTTGNKLLLDQRAGRVMLFGNGWIYPQAPVPYTRIREECNDTEYNPIVSCPAGKNCLQHANNSYYFGNKIGTETMAARVSPSVSSDYYCDGSVCGASAIVNDPLLIVENVKFWSDRATAFDGTIDAPGSCGVAGGSTCTKSGIGIGTLASRPATCTEGTAYWATTQDWSSFTTSMVGVNPAVPLSGTLYKCGAGNTWTESYTPYTYPHPLRNPRSQGNGAITQGVKSQGVKWH
jgi:hypothetical protein